MSMHDKSNHFSWEFRARPRLQQNERTTLTQDKIKQRGTNVPTHVRYNDLVSIRLFLGLLRRNGLESDLHHVCLFVCRMPALSRFRWAGFVRRAGPLYSGEARSPPGHGDIKRASSMTNERCVGLKEKPPRRCQNKRDTTFSLKTK